MEKKITMDSQAIDYTLKMNPVMDAGDGAFFSRELEHIKAKPYNKKYAGIEFRTAFPISHEAGEGANSVTVQTYDRTGIAKIINGYATDLPRADIRGQEFTVPVKQTAISYGYSTDEIRGSQMVGKSLDAKRATAAMEGNEKRLDQIAFFGDAGTGLFGLKTFPGIPETTVATKAATGTTWAVATPDEILFDLNNAVAVMASITKMREVPDTILMPVRQYNLIKRTPRSENSDTTILQYFLENNEGITVEQSNFMAGFGTGGTDAFVLYRKDEDAIAFEMPMEFRQHAPQLHGLEWEISCESKTGGFNCYYPMSLAFWIGI